MMCLKTVSVLLAYFLAHLVMLPVTVVHYTAAGRQMITRMQDRSVLCRLTHLGLLVCVDFASPARFKEFIRAQK